MTRSAVILVDLRGTRFIVGAMCAAFSAPRTERIRRLPHPSPLRQAHNTFTKCLTKRLTGASLHRSPPLNTHVWTPDFGGSAC